MQVDRLPLTEVAARVAPSAGKKVSLGTVRRWTKKGILSPLGTRVLLQTERIGGRYYTRVEWLEEFIALCSGQRRCDLTRQRRRKGKSQARKLLEEEFGFEYSDVGSASAAKLQDPMPDPSIPSHVRDNRSPTVDRSSSEEGAADGDRIGRLPFKVIVPDKPAG